MPDDWQSVVNHTWAPLPSATRLHPLSHRRCVCAQVKGVTLYVSDFRRPLTERITKDFFSDPSQTSVACVRTGPVTFDKVRL